MGQVPKNTDVILLVGNGRTSRHLSFYFQSLNYKILRWHYKDNSYDELKNLFKICTYCFILIKDDAIPQFIEENYFLKSEKSFHCSGLLITEGITSIHPLMTFSESLYDISFYQKIHWAIFEKNKCLTDYIPRLTNPFFYVNPIQKNLYHGLCVMSGNFTQLLLQQVLFQWENSLQLSQESLQPYMQQTLDNFWKSGTKALTGPLARKDFGTIRKHLKSLQHSNLLNLYQTFLKLYLSEQEIKELI
jgi:hypothetical protein